jgi:hypothetical protein
LHVAVESREAFDNEAYAPIAIFVPDVDPEWSVETRINFFVKLGIDGLTFRNHSWISPVQMKAAFLHGEIGFRRQSYEVDCSRFLSLPNSLQM